MQFLSQIYLTDIFSFIFGIFKIQKYLKIVKDKNIGLQSGLPTAMIWRLSWAIQVDNAVAVTSKETRPTHTHNKS